MLPLNQKIFIATQALLLTKGKIMPLKNAMPTLRNLFNETFQTPHGPQKHEPYVRYLINYALKGYLGQDKRKKKTATVLNPEKFKKFKHILNSILNIVKELLPLPLTFPGELSGLPKNVNLILTPIKASSCSHLTHVLWVILSCILLLTRRDSWSKYK